MTPQQEILAYVYLRILTHPQNYTSTGFEKIKTPKPLWDLINSYWLRNKDKGDIEDWGIGNIYSNNWAAPSRIVDIDDTGLRGGGSRLMDSISEAARPTIEEWIGMKLQEASVYGIRIYSTGAMVAPHVDRTPLISSCIINVDQDVDEPWMLEVYDRHDRAVNISMEVRSRLREFQGTCPTPAAYLDFFVLNCSQEIC